MAEKTYMELGTSIPLKLTKAIMEIGTQQQKSVATNRKILLCIPTKWWKFFEFKKNTRKRYLEVISDARKLVSIIPHEVNSKKISG